jgi:hypothetical protein
VTSETHDNFIYDSRTRRLSDERWHGSSMCGGVYT